MLKLRPLERKLSFRLFVALLTLYCAFVVVLLRFPHRLDSFGKMELHQAFAATGAVLSVGLVDRTLVDWYMLGPTLEVNIPPYDRCVRETVVRLTPVYLLWFVGIAIFASRLGRWFSRESNPASNPPMQPTGSAGG